MKDEELDNICEECKKEDESVSQNLIIHGYKICDSCKYQKLFFQFNLGWDRKVAVSSLKKQLELKNQ